MAPFFTPPTRAPTASPSAGDRELSPWVYNYSQTQTQTHRHRHTHMHGATRQSAQWESYETWDSTETRRQADAGF